VIDGEMRDCGGQERCVEQAAAGVAKTLGDNWVPKPPICSFGDAAKSLMELA
jgi:hypothetical protein